MNPLRLFSYFLLISLSLGLDDHHNLAETNPDKGWIEFWLTDGFKTLNLGSKYEVIIAKVWESWKLKMNVTKTNEMCCAASWEVWGTKVINICQSDSRSQLIISSSSLSTFYQTYFHITMIWLQEIVTVVLTRGYFQGLWSLTILKRSENEWQERLISKPNMLSLW